MAIHPTECSQSDARRSEHLRHSRDLEITEVLGFNPFFPEYIPKTGVSYFDAETKTWNPLPSMVQFREKN